MNVRFARVGVVVIALILTVAAWAQAEPNKSNNVSIKFKFIVGGKILEPGGYAVDVAENGNVTLTPDKGSAVELAPVKSLGKKKLSKLELVFEESGSTMYLAEVWMPEKAGVRVANVDAPDRRQTVSPKNTK